MNQLNINRPNCQGFSNPTTCDADGLEVTLDVKLVNNLQTAWSAQQAKNFWTDWQLTNPVWTTFEIDLHQNNILAMMRKNMDRICRVNLKATMWKNIPGNRISDSCENPIQFPKKCLPISLPTRYFIYQWIIKGFTEQWTFAKPEGQDPMIRECPVLHKQTFTENWLRIERDYFPYRGRQETTYPIRQITCADPRHVNFQN